jgi:hypothetical protein
MAAKMRELLLRRFVFAGDVFLFFVYLTPDLYELMFGQPFANMQRGELNTFIMFEAGALIYCYAIITAMVQRYSSAYLAGFKHYRVRRIILFIAAYFCLLGVIFNLQGYTGLFPAEVPVPPETGAAVQLFFLVSSLAGLILSVRYYRFLGGRKEGK